MIIQVDAGFEAAISLFEDGWASGAMREDASPPNHIDPSLYDFWHDGYAAGVADSMTISVPNPSIH